MAEVTGVVEGVSTKFGKYSILVNGTWYGTKEEWASVKPNKGDNVTFDDGGGKFMKKVKINGGGGSAASPAPSGGGGKRFGGFPIAIDDGQRSILRQNALTNARELVCKSLKDGAKVDMKVVETIIEIAREFEAYTSGDIEAFEAAAAKGAMEEAFEVK